MKKLLSYSIAALALTASLQSTAQTEQGKILVAGESNLNMLSSTESWKSDDDSDTESKSFQINFTPVAGYFVIDNLAVGGMLALNYYSYKPEGEGNEKSTGTSAILLPFARYYFGSSSVRPFVEAAAGLGTSKSKTKSDYLDEDEEYNYAVKAAALSGGVDIFLNDNVALDLGLVYQYSATKKKENNDNNFRTITKGFGMNAGIVVVF